MNLWWLSFADSTRPEGEQFLGVCIVCAHDFINAVRVSHALGLNPGGEVSGTKLEGFPPEYVDRWVERRLTKADLAEFPGGITRADGVQAG